MYFNLEMELADKPMKRPLFDVTNAWITISVSLTLMKGRSWAMQRR